MKVIAINGSHRKGKNTAALLQIVLDELSKNNIENELIELMDLNLKRCAACNKCLRRAQCSIQDDDMVKLTPKLLAADGIILGSPVYWANVSTAMKNFMDRTRFLHMSKNLLAGKIGAAVVNAGLRNGGQELCTSIIENYLKAQGLIIADSRDPEGAIRSVGVMGTLQCDLDSNNNIVWRSRAVEDSIAVDACRQLAKNILKLLQLRKRS
jgi:multimeric flavodoxin WrbA